MDAMFLSREGLYLGCHMPGAPLMQRLEKFLAENGGDAFIFDQIANGIPVGKIAKSLGVSRPFRSRRSWG
jgi:hypothetical protein